MEYKVGELFYDTVQGLCCVTELDPQSIDVCSKPALPDPWGKANRIGKYVRMLDNKTYLLYKKPRHHSATDEDIIEYLTNTMLNFTISDNVAVTLYKNCELVYLSDDRESIAIHQDNISKIIEVLNRELNF